MERFRTAKLTRLPRALLPTDMTDRFAVAIGVTDSELRVLVQVPPEIDSAWTDPEAFQSLVETIVWDRLDKSRTLGTISQTAETGEKVFLGTVTVEPDETVVDTSLSLPDSS